MFLQHLWDVNDIVEGGGGDEVWLSGLTGQALYLGEFASSLPHPE